MSIPDWSPAYLESILAISLFTIGYVIYYFIAHSESLLLRFKKKFGEIHGHTRFLWMTRYLGAVSIGLLPALLVMLIAGNSPADYGFQLGDGWHTLYWIVGLAALILPLTRSNARKSETHKFYPNVREREWTKSMVFHNAITWVIYLFGYELMFRGTLLFASVRAFGAWPAIILNVAFYTLVHMPKSMKESIGAVPFGLIVCLITLSTGSIWGAFALHVVMALSTFFFTLHYNQEMKML